MSAKPVAWIDRLKAAQRMYAQSPAQARALAIAEAARVVAAYKVSVGNSAAGEIAAEMTMDALRELHDEILTLAGQPEYPSSADDEATLWRHGEKALTEALAGFEGKTAQPSAISDEWVSVPREPTEAMLIAARDWSYAKYGKPIGNDAAIGCWSTMLAAAQEGK